jgi:hypothetical protein
MSYADFSSWPREQEQSFVVYEQHATESSKKAMVVGVEPDRRDVTKGMNMSNLSKKSQKAAPAEPAAAPDKK